MTSQRPSPKRKVFSLPDDKTFHLLFKNNPIPMWVYDLKTLIFLEVNDAALEKYGYAHDEFLKLTLKDIRPAEDVARLTKDVKQKRPALQHSGEWRHRLKNGRVIDVEITSHTMEFEGRKAALVMAQDITERKRADEALRRRAEELAALQANVLEIATPHDLPTLLQTVVERAAQLLNARGGGLYLCDPDRKEVRCVVSYNTLLDYTGTTLAFGEGAAGIVAQSGKPLIIDDYRVWNKRAVVYEGEQPFTCILSVPMIWQNQVMGVIHILDNVESRRFTETDLALLTLFANHAAIAVENTRLYETAQNEITERVRTEEELRHRDELLKEMSRIARIGAWEFDAMTGQGTWSEETARIHDLDPSHKTNTEIGLSFYRDESRARIEQAVQEAIEQGKPYALELELVTAKGIHKWVRTIGQPIREGHKVVKVRGTFQDITEQVQAEEMLHESEARYRSLFENMIEGFAYCKMIFEDSQPVDFIYLDVNNAFEIQTGLKDVVGRSVLEVIPGIRESSPELFDIYGRVAATGRAERFEIYLEPLAMWFSISVYSPQKEYFVAVFDVITGRKQAEQALQQRARELQALYEISLMVSAQTSLDSLLPVIVKQAASLLGTDSASLFLIEPDGGSLKLRVSHNLPQENIDITLKLGEGLAGQVAQCGEPINVEDYQNWSGRANVFSDTPFRRTLGVPLNVNERVIGVINVLDFNLTGLFSKEQVQLMRLFADQAALAIESVRLHEQERMRHQELATLYESAMTISSNLSLEIVLKTVVEQTARALNAEGCALSFWDQERDILTTMVDYRKLSPDKADIPGTTYSLKDYPATRRAFETHQPLFQSRSDPRADPAELALMERLGMGTLLLLPVVTRDQVIGLMELYETANKERVFTEGEIRLAQSLSAQTAIFIDNARLFEHAERRLRRTEALRAIDAAITGGKDINTVFNVIFDQTFTQLGVDAAVILLYDPTEQVLKYANERGFRTVALQHTHLLLGEGYAGRIALGRQMIHIPNLQGRQTDFLRSPTFSEEGFISYFGVPLIAKGEIKGVLEVFHRTAFEAETEWLNFLETLAGQAAIAVDNATLFKDLQLSNIELSTAYDATITGWSHAMDLRDEETENHTLRVTEMTERLARRMGIGDAELVHIRRGSLLHDIGKIGVPDDILHKPGKLTDEEWVHMRQHPQSAHDMLAPIAYLRPAMDIPYCHHEKWDGTGYPRGLKGEQIPLAARIFAVVDVYDALTSDRPYRKAWSKKKTLEYIREQSGIHFDPAVVAAFLEAMSAAPKKKTA